MKTLFLPVLVAILSPQASPDPMGQETRFRPGDLIVTGYVTTRDYESLGEFNTSGVMIAELRVAKILRGRAPSRILTVRYIAHMDLPKGEELRFHLRRASPESWLVCKKGNGEGYICG